MNRTYSATARRLHELAISTQALAASSVPAEWAASQRIDAEAPEAPAALEPGQQQHDGGRGDAGGGDDGEPGARPGGEVGEPGRHGGHRRQGGAVQEADEHDRQADGAEAGLRRPEAAHDGDPDDVVEAARQRDPGHGRRASRGSERGRARTHVATEERFQPNALAA